MAPGVCTQVSSAADEPEDGADDRPILTKEAILAAADTPTERVNVPEWGGAVYVRTLPGYERDSFEQACQDAQRGKRINIVGLKARLVIQSVCGEDGKPLFSMLDAEALNRKSSRVIDRLFKVAQKLNGLTQEDVEELAKNSDSDRSGDSGSS